MLFQHPKTLLPWFTEGLEPCKTEGFDGGRNLAGDGIFICTNFSDECQGDITIGSLQTCTIDNNVLVKQNFLDLDLVVANFGSNEVSILLGKGIGRFGLATPFAVAGVAPDYIAIGEFN